MKQKILYTVICLFFSSCAVFADRFVPEFKIMKTIKCEADETIYKQDGTVVTQNKYFRIFKLDDENKKIYLQKAPVYKISYYEQDKLEFQLEHLTDDFIMMSSVTIDRKNGQYSSESRITYDNDIFGIRHAKAQGFCHLVN